MTKLIEFMVIFIKVNFHGDIKNVAKCNNYRDYANQQSTGNWQAIINEQKVSVTFLINILKSMFQLTDYDIYGHDQVSYILK